MLVPYSIQHGRRVQVVASQEYSGLYYGRYTDHV
jgi:hypothetical protein